MMTNENTYQKIVSRNRRGFLGDLVTGLLLAVGMVSGTSALTTTRLPTAAIMDVVLKANPMPEGDLAPWACASGDEAKCDPA
jgi:hypothetical protein